MVIAVLCSLYAKKKTFFDYSFLLLPSTKAYTFCNNRVCHLNDMSRFHWSHAQLAAGAMLFPSPKIILVLHVFFDREIG